MIAILALALCDAADAGTVVVLGSGALGTAGGIYQPGDPFSFTTRYDEAAPRLSSGPGVYAAYSSVGTAPIVTTVRGDTIVASVLYSMIVSSNHFFIGTPADYSPTTAIDFTLTRPDGSDFSLPSAAELQRATGVLSFVYRGAPGLAGSGSGSLAASPAAVPEPGITLMLASGLASIALVDRRSSIAQTRTSRSRPRRERPVPSSGRRFAEPSDDVTSVSAR